MTALRTRAHACRATARRRAGRRPRRPRPSGGSNCPPRPAPAGRAPRDPAASDLALRHATLIIFVAVLVWFGAQTPGFLAPESLGNIVKQAAFIGIAAIGITFVLLTAGIDLSVGSRHVPSRP